MVVADEQTAGRGRLGNSFFSPLGGLYCSLVLRPHVPPPRAPLIGLAAGLALAEAIQAVSGLTPVLKWPNDLLLSGRKLSGVLLELATAGDRVRYAIQGIGVNLNVPEADFPPELRNSATSLLRELGQPLSPDSLLYALLPRFESRYEGLGSEGAAGLLSAWRAWPNLLGQTVRIASANPWQGRAEDLDLDGALLVRLPSGDLRRVVAGDVHLLTEQAPPTRGHAERRLPN
jgi:BirA family transcriptional regulator, biotin operon repressor / biotin---[acetyl-CoA-carboxylase] ligase